ncbi:hypothetical protein LAZ67_3004509 [Cordylochernes scorpioides]|uniref:DUF5641 domain-containing protein n=1 Tax=Cordylochernes scorpioides TaxID=51811 RepID=A0ABY6KB83_9ARAC|nr:hypothetical protein LAZ67_3004509 [Cordylochernes scorpioides]
MGELPLERVVPSRPFQRVGAIHLEVVSDLTAEAFIATLRRFTSRRGLLSDFFSDNAKNFKLANRFLLDFYRELNIQNFCAQRGIRWHFIPPPPVPHFGGLWEAGIKSVKSNLIKVTKSAILNFEVFYPLLTQIEAILNSRPLLPLDSNFDSYFKIKMQPLAISFFYYNMRNNKRNSLRKSHWKCIQSMKNSFWKKWSQDYLNLLQGRPRWHKTDQDLQSGQLCTHETDSTPPHHWPLARIIDTCKGPDGHVRDVDLKTPKNVLKRPITKIAPLPFKELILFFLDSAVQQGGGVCLVKKDLSFGRRHNNMMHGLLNSKYIAEYNYINNTKREIRSRVYSEDRLPEE